MCPGCGPVWTFLHALWSGLYVTCGAVQLIAGIFFIICIPQLHLVCNLCVGTWNVIIGIVAGMLACFGQMTCRRQEFLLYMAVSILMANVINAILSEWSFYQADMPKLLTEHPYHTLINCACLATRVATAAIITISFLDSQISFCSMQIAPKPNKMKTRSSHEQVSDIEYIIPRPKSSKTHTVYNAYSQSWVYDADIATGSATNNTSSPYVKLRHDSPQKEPLQNDTAHLIDNPVVHIEEASDDSNSNGDRKLCYMKSFSRSTSPVLLSASSSQLSLAKQTNPQVYDYLEKLTDPKIYRNRLNSAHSDDQYQAPQMRRGESKSPTGENVQYASLMKELQKAIVGKKEPSVKSPPSSESDKTQSNSRQESSRSEGKSSDAEFSKELEAALQLIQDLESPNTTIETPSEVKSFDARQLPLWRNSDASESEKTLSAVGSLAEIASPLNECQPELYTFKPAANGKGARVVVHYSDSQSTSGYSSPTHPSDHQWSTTSSISDSHNDISRPLSYTIHNDKSTAVISLYPQSQHPKGKNVSLVKITSDSSLAQFAPEDNSTLNESGYEEFYRRNMENRLSNQSGDGEQSKGSSVRKSAHNAAAVWNVRSLLRRKKNVPKLSPELEAAIVKSESLAYLNKFELLARHQRNSEIQRQIEQRVLQQLAVPRAESNC